MKIQLIPDWKTLWHKLWSVRLALAAAVFSAIEAGYTAYATGTVPAAAIITGLISLAGAVSRIVAQPTLTDEA